MATAPSLRNGGARVYSQSGDIDQLLEDVWVPDGREQGLDKRRSGGRQRLPDPPATENERTLMTQLADAQRQLRELGQLQWGSSGSGPQSPGRDRDGYGGGRPKRAWNTDRTAGGPSRPRGDYSEQRDSWDGSSSSSSSGSSSRSRSPTTNSGRESPEPLYVNTEIAAAAARVPTPPPRTRFPQQQQKEASSLLPAGPSGASAVAKKGSTTEQSRCYQHSSEKASASKHEESFEVEENVSIFQVFPPVGGMPPKQSPNRQRPQQQAPVLKSPSDGRLHNFPIADGGVSPGGAFGSPPPQSQVGVTRPPHGGLGTASSRGAQFTAACSSSAHQSSSSRQTEQHHNHDHRQQSASILQPSPSHRPPSGGAPPVIGCELGDNLETNRSQHQHAYRSEMAHSSSCNSHSATHQTKEASSSSEQKSQGVSDVYSETTSLRPIGAGIHTLRSHTSQHTLRQTSSGYQIGNNRFRTLNLSTPRLDQPTPGAAFKSDQHLAAPRQPGGVGPLRAATLQASAIEPRSSFLRASSSSDQQKHQQQQHNHQHQHQHQQHNHQHQHQHQQQQQHLQVGGYGETMHQSSRTQYNSSSRGGGGGWTVSPGSVTPTRRFSGHSAGGGGGFDFDPPSPGGLLRFVNDTSQLWYLPNISREDAIGILRPLPPGRFVVRDSTSFPSAYGLAVKVAEVPLGAVVTAGDSATDELVRHFLIEQTSKGVRIRGCANEPVFASLAALIYQHTVMPLALPCKLTLPDTTDAMDAAADITGPAGGALDPRVILEQGAACNVLYLGATDIESLTGSGGLTRAVDALLRNRDRLRSCICQLKVAKEGISLTDTARRQFFRKHYPTACVLHCAMDPGLRCFDSSETKARGMNRSKIFGFVARKNPGSQENTAVVMCEIEEHQPAEAVVRFVCKYLIGGR